MFELISSTASARFTDSEKPVINQRLQEFQEKKGIVFASFKELFTNLLNDALNSENIEIKEIEKPIPDGLHLFSTENKEVFEAMLDQLNNYATKQGIQEETPLVDVLKTAIENAEKQPQTVEVEKEIVKTVEKQLENNEILLTLTDDGAKTIEKKLILLGEISKRRYKKYGGIPEPIEVLCEKMIFNDGTIFNLSGEFHTGF